MKKLTAYSLTFAVLLFMGSAAFAADDVVLFVGNFNDASVSNHVESTADTGSNEQAAGEDIEGGASIDTGYATAESDVNTEVNTNDTTIEVAEVDDAFVGIANGNEARVKNHVEPEAYTGWNVQAAGDDIDGDAEINTGDAESEATVDTTMNQNTNEVLLDDADDVFLGVGNFNEGRVKNHVEPLSDTGLNVQDADEDIEGPASINTGDATADADVETDVNSNETEVETGEADDVFGGVLNLNSARVKNHVEPEAYTGWNVQAAGDDIAGGADVTTGDAEATDKVVTRQNKNVVRFN